MYRNIILNLSVPNSLKLHLCKPEKKYGHELNIYYLIVILIGGLHWFSIYEWHSITLHCFDVLYHMDSVSATLH